MQRTETAATLVGRVLLSLLFVRHGWLELMAPADTQAAFAEYNLPMLEAVWLIAIVVELGGGLAIVLGLFARPIGLVMAIWCVATAVIAHANLAERAQEIQF